MAVIAKGNIVEITGMENKFLIAKGNIVEIMNLAVVQPMGLRKRNQYISFLEAIK